MSDFPKIILHFAILLVFLGCRQIDYEKQKAERLYNEAHTIINNTTNNGLSRALSKKALNYINDAIDLNPNQSKYYRVRGTTYFHLKKYNDAIKNFNKSVELDSTNYLAWMGLGIVHENTQRFNSAKNYYQKALNDPKLSKSVHLNLGLLCTKWDKYDEAIREYNEVLAIDETEISAYFGRGNVFTLQRKFNAAIDDYNHVIQSEPKNKLAYNARGLAKQKLGLNEAAIVDFKKCLNLKLDDSFNDNFSFINSYVFNNMANSYLKMNKLDLSCHYWKKSIEHGYIYQEEWKSDFNIENPIILIDRHCEK